MLKILKPFSGLRWKVLLFIVIAVLLSVVLYMFLAPGTWYQKLRCEKGRIKGHSAYFEFVSSDHQVCVDLMRAHHR